MNWRKGELWEWWRAYGEEFVARSGDVTVAAVSWHGEIDWSAVYGLELADDEWLWAEWRHGPSGTIVEVGRKLLGPAFAVLVATLVPGDPGAVEFHDQESGELVLRLEATRMGFGWALICEETWLSADGVAWEQVPFPSEIEFRGGVEVRGCAVLDDDVYVTVAEEFGLTSRTVGLWIGRLEQ